MHQTCGLRFDEIWRLSTWGALSGSIWGALRLRGFYTIFNILPEIDVSDNFDDGDGNRWC